MKKHGCLLFVIMFCHITQASCQFVRDSFVVYFDFGVSELDSYRQSGLDSLWYHSSLGCDIHITGYSDEPGTAAGNRSIAGKRAAAVGNWLLASGLKKGCIKRRKGVGNTIRSGKDPVQRRVVIHFMKAQKPPVAGSFSRLTSMKINERLPVNNLIFEDARARLLRGSLPVMDTLYRVLNYYPRLAIHIEGHVCCGPQEDVGRQAQLTYSYELSEQRAQAIYDTLVARGISSDRLSCEGFGFSRPKVFPEKVKADPWTNRRVEIKLLRN